MNLPTEHQAHEALTALWNSVHVGDGYNLNVVQTRLEYLERELNMKGNA